MTAHEIALAIRREIGRQDMTPLRVAGLSGVHPNTVLRINSHDNMRLDTLTRIAEAVGLEVCVRKKE